ncbi:MAG: Y-family DNA polymerase [Cellvibrionales bacterium]|nr:Y-family DNA polymerase [Cellvibrionales bacterium]
MYALVDCNSFFASCEQIFRPELRGKPVVVLSNNDGCVVARSKEAKALNIPDLHAYFKIKDQLLANDVRVFSSNYELYADISQRVVSTLREYTDALEVYSIDESFLQLDGFQENFYLYGQSIKAKVWQDVRMPVCVGIGQTKTLAKLANRIAKKSKKLNGVCVLDDLAGWAALFKKMPVDSIWGIGSRLGKRLALLGIKSVYDLQQANSKWIRKHFGVMVERVVAELNGERCYQLDKQPENKQQIFSTRSFGEKITTLNPLQQAVSQYAQRAAIKLRKQQGLTQTLLVFIETSRFEQSRLSQQRVISLDYPTNDTRVLIKAAKQGVSAIFKSGYRYARAGVGLLDIREENPTQLNFFDRYQSKKATKLMQVVDQLNKKEMQVFFASTGIDPFWSMQRRLKSPAYTTRLSEIPVVK